MQYVSFTLRLWEHWQTAAVPLKRHNSEQPPLLTEHGLLLVASEQKQEYTESSFIYIYFYLHK